MFANNLAEIIKNRRPSLSMDKLEGGRLFENKIAEYVETL